MKNIVYLLLFIAFKGKAQTDNDGLMMEKKLLCIGATYGKTAWKNYWEGTYKRENLNLGTVSVNNACLMGNYGITDKLGAIFSIPFRKTNASAGQLKGQQGIQDLSIFLKWVGIQKTVNKGTLSGIIVGGFSMPMSDYSPDVLPLSIGLKSMNMTSRIMLDYQKNNWTGTFSAAYIYRGNVTLDKNTYYTTVMNYSNEVRMPNAANLNLRLGYRSQTWIIEAIANQWNTLGGFDITTNNMPFVSNKMNATFIGLHAKYETDFINGLSFVFDANTTVAGRNVGKSNGLQFGVFYIMNLAKNNAEEKK